MIRLPEFSSALCTFTGQVELTRDGFCIRCGSTDHEVVEL